MKFFAFFVLSLFLVIFLIVPSILAADVAYILNDVDKADSVLVSSIQELGFSVDLVDYNIPANFSQYKLILISNEKFLNPGLIPVASKNIILILDDTRTTNIEAWGFGESVIQTSRFRARVYELGHRIVDNIESVFSFYTSASAIYSLKIVPSGLKRIIVKEDDYNFGIIYAVDIGVSLYGRTSNTRAVIFGIPDTSKWTNNAKILFQNSVSWAMFGDDNDRDNYQSPADCNDSNPDIHPNATEIPYNSVDENCDGYDLLDVDSDGYCKIGLHIQSKSKQCRFENSSTGTDCDDEEASVHPNTSDLSKNCVNDAPKKRPGQSNLGSYIIEEGEERLDAYNLNEYFLDYDNDALIFNVVGNSNLSQHLDIRISDGFVDIFLKNWYGKETFHFTASDGILTANSNDVTITAIEINDCNQKEGFICNENEICRGNKLNSTDAELCCSVECEEDIAFSGIDLCENLSSIKIKINKPYSEDSFKPGEDINLSVEITNNLNKTFDGNVRAYFYSIDNDDVIDDLKHTLKLLKASKKTLSFEFNTDYKIEDGEYALYVKAEDKECNDEYVKIKIEKQEQDVFINSFDLPIEASCGEDINFKVKAFNRGQDIEDVYILLENKELKLSEESETFNLDSGDNKEEEFSFTIPQTKNKDYNIKASVFYGDKSNYKTASLTIKGCPESIVTTNKNNTNSSASFGVNPSSVKVDNGFSPAVIAIMAVNGFFIIAIIGFIVFMIFKKSGKFGKRSKRKRKKVKKKLRRRK